MPLAPSYLPVTFAAARARLAGRQSKKIGNNTWLEQAGEDFVVRYHRTHIVRFTPEGQVILSTGGWQTTTTKARLSYVASAYGLTLGQKDYVWSYRHRATGVEIPYQDGLDVSRLVIAATA